MDTTQTAATTATGRDPYPGLPAVLDRAERLLAATAAPDGSGLSVHWRAGWRTHVTLVRAAHAAPTRGSRSPPATAVCRWPGCPSPASPRKPTGPGSAS